MSTPESPQQTRPFLLQHHELQCLRMHDDPVLLLLLETAELLEDAENNTQGAETYALCMTAEDAEWMADCLTSLLLNKGCDAEGVQNDLGRLLETLLDRLPYQ